MTTKLQAKKPSTYVLPKLNRAFTQPELSYGNEKVDTATRIKHCSGGVCVACNRVLETKDMTRRGFISTAELGLCTGCFVHIYKTTMNRDEIETISSDMLHISVRSYDHYEGCYV